MQKYVRPMFSVREGLSSLYCVKSNVDQHYIDECCIHNYAYDFSQNFNNFDHIFERKIVNICLLVNF